MGRVLGCERKWRGSEGSRDGTRGTGKTYSRIGKEEALAASRSVARQRILEVATELFYRDGIRSVGVDTIVEQSGVGKATLYRHFPSKDDLIAAYLEERDQLLGKRFEEVMSPHEGSPRAQLSVLVDAVVELLMGPGYRGCTFLNALAEFSDADHPAHRRAVEHKRALRSRLYLLSRQSGARDPEALADQLLLLINGAVASVPPFSPARAGAQLKTIATHLIGLQLDSAQGKP